MPPIPKLTLADAAATVLGRARSDREQAQTAVATANEALAEARAAQAAAAESLAAIDKELADIRAKLATADPADADALAADLQERTIAERQAQAAAVDAEEEVERRARAADATAGALAAADRGFEKATAAAAEAEEAAARHRAWIASLDGVLSTLPADATAAKAGARYTAAQAALAAAFPAKLLARARDRAAREQARLAEQRALARYARATLGTLYGKPIYGDAGTLDDARVDYALAEADVADVVLHGKDELARALALADRAAAAPPPSDDEVAAAGRAEFLDPATDADAAKNTVKLEEARDEARDELEAKQRDLDEAILDELPKDPDEPDPASAAITAARNALPALETALADAEEALDQPVDEAVPDGETRRENLRRWEAQLPDRVWRALADFAEATAILDRLAGLNLGTLKGALVDAEDAYAKALVQSTKTTRWRDVLGAVAARYGDEAAAGDRVGSARVFAALRGGR